MDLINSIKNRCECAGIVMTHERPDLVYTLFEDIFEDAQELMDYCEVKDAV